MSFHRGASLRINNAASNPGKTKGTCDEEKLVVALCVAATPMMDVATAIDT
jgi:hypothetical protein